MFIQQEMFYKNVRCNLFFFKKTLIAVYSLLLVAKQNLPIKSPIFFY